MSPRLQRLGVIALGACVLVGCDRTPAEPGGAAGPPTVTVATPIQREVTDDAEYPGRMAAINSLEVRARVSGYLQQIRFKDGAEVKEGQVLYVIDPRPYQASYDQAAAQQRLQEANLKYQQALYERNVGLSRTGAVSREELQQTLAQRDTAVAQVNAARAAVEQARLNLTFTEIKSPISGRLSRTFITLGNLVVADQTLLTTVVSEDPIYTYFDVDELTMLRVQALIRAGKFRSSRSGARVPVRLGLATEHGFPHEGYVDFVNNQVTPSTGTLQIRALFDNPGSTQGARLLSPGLFVRVQVPVSAAYEALLVAQRAVGTDQNVKFVLTLDEQNKVVRRNVELGSEQDGLQVVSSGLAPGQRVIVNGLQRAIPGQVVNPTVIPMLEAVNAAEPGTASVGSNSPGAAAPTQR